MTDLISQFLTENNFYDEKTRRNMRARAPQIIKSCESP